MIDIEAKDLETITMILKQYVPQYKVVVFGSRAKNTAKRSSDIDLCLIGKIPLSINQLATLENAFSSSDLNIKVDLVDWRRTQTNFRNIIEKDSLIIQEPES